jgi:hypothetical protein
VTSKVSANPVELAVAAAFLGGQLAPKDVETFAAKTAAELQAGGVDPGAWRDSVARWIGAEQSVVWRARATELLNDNRAVLDNLAAHIDSIAKLPAVAAEHPTQAEVEDRLVQLGYGADGRMTAAQIAADPAFLEKGRFASYPGLLVPPPEMEVGKKGSSTFEVPVDTALLDDPTGRELSSGMDRQWSFLHDRGVEGYVNPNTLTRYAYNQFAVRRILDNLEDRGVKNASVLLVTGYETPIHELLESNLVKEVVVADLSEHAARMLAAKYANHPQAGKLKIEVKDFSGIDLAAQKRAIEKLGTPKKDEPLSAQVSEAYFTELNKPENLTAIDYPTERFDAVHLPFVSGSFQLGAATSVAGRQSDGYVDMEAFFGAAGLSTPKAQGTLALVDRHVFDEARRMTKPGGLVITEVWARPIENPTAPIRYSDTPVTQKMFGEMTAGLGHLFSGNPQPGLPHTVGHILAEVRQ